MEQKPVKYCVYCGQELPDEEYAGQQYRRCKHCKGMNWIDEEED